MPSVPAYRGNVYSVFGAAGYALDNDTDVTIDYAYSRSENLRNNSAAGLPLGLDNQHHGLTAGLSHRIRKNIVSRLRYGFYESTGKGTGGVNSYHAQLASASCTVGF